MFDVDSDSEINDEFVKIHVISPENLDIEIENSFLYLDLTKPITEIDFYNDKNYKQSEVGYLHNTDTDIDLRIRQSLTHVETVHIHFTIFDICQKWTNIKYLPGHFFKRHVDRPVSDDRAQETALLLLPKKVSSYEGGELIVYNDFDEQVKEITADEDNYLLVIFNSRLFHEVKPVISGVRTVYKTTIDLPDVGAQEIEYIQNEMICDVGHGNY
tara:strand:+ start:244 stop:885 length:642 start_codon:yes stop_codon:yes gene_type:complete